MTKRVKRNVASTPTSTATPASSLAPQELSPSPHASKRGKTRPDRAPAPRTSFSLTACRKWFATYLSQDGDKQIEPAGVMKLCEDLNVTPENPVLLVLASDAGCERMGYFTWNEWLSAMNKYQCASAGSLKAKLPLLEARLTTPTELDVIYKFAYDFARSAQDNPAQRSLDKDLAIDMWQLLLRRGWPLLPTFLNFVRSNAIKVVTRDQWRSLLAFARENTDTVENYDETQAWPVLIDEFVDEVRA